MVAPQEIASTGKVLHPPYGRTWRESVRWLIDTGTGTERERWVLDRLAVRMAAWPDHQKPRISPELAAEVVRIAGELNQQGEAA